MRTRPFRPTRGAATAAIVAGLVLAAAPALSATEAGDVTDPAQDAAAIAVLAHHAAAAPVFTQVERHDGDLEPRYQPREPQPEPAYDSSYFFALSRTLADSTLVPAAKAPLFLLTIPIDVALLPIALIGGFFG